MRYFKDCKTAEDVKTRFKELAKKLHPDCGGNAEEFKKMIQEYETAFEKLKNIHTSAEGQTYESKKASQQTAQQFADIITKIIFCDGLHIEICGTWIWVTGNTYPHKETLKAAGFVWSKSKKAWYNAGEPLQGKRRGRYSLSQIRQMHGSEEVETEKRAGIAG